MKKIVKKTLTFLIFIGVATLPFISMTNLIGIELFLDSFENPNGYVYIENQGRLLASNQEDNSYIIIQKSSHPEFTVVEKDQVLYLSNDGELACDSVLDIEGIHYFKKYYLKESNNPEENIIFENQVIGKIVKTIDNNFWSTLSIKLWDVSINELNIRALYSDE